MKDVDADAQTDAAIKEDLVSVVGTAAAYGLYLL